MINVYPVKIEACDEDTGDVVFRMETFDAHSASIEIKTIIGPDNVKEPTAAIEQAVTMLDLK